MHNNRVAIAISGGIDSSMAALMLKEKGYDVLGIHFSFDDKKYDTIKSLSTELEIPILVKDIRNEFEIVKQHFVDEYFKGRTPSPCTFCNRILKWKILDEFAQENNCKYIASGHYIRKKIIDKTFYLQRAVDRVKDQSYFLWELDANFIQKMITPLGNYTKDEIREFAKKNGFGKLLLKKESMGICFLNNKDYRHFLAEYAPEMVSKIAKGNILNKNGDLIGNHKGYIYYTIGQKRDLNLRENKNYYVVGINSVKNELIADTKESLAHYHIELGNIRIRNKHDFKKGEKVNIIIRGYGLNPETPAIIKHFTENYIKLKLTSPAWAVAPGQPVVFYQDDIVLGGGIAESSW